MKTMDREVQNLYKISDIQKIFSCSRGKAYGIIHLPGFPKLQIGRQFYVVPEEFMKWLKMNKDNSYL